MNDIMNRTWLGYARKNGKKGIRNRVLVIYTVKCAEHVARQIVERSGSGDVENHLGPDTLTDTMKDDDPWAFSTECDDIEPLLELVEYLH